MAPFNYEIRKADPSDFEAVGQLMVEVYSQLNGFPLPTEQPEYYQKLRNVGVLTEKKGTEIFIAISNNDEVCGALVYFADMANYGSGGSAIHEKNAAGFRLLAVDPKFRGKGIAKALSEHCILKTKTIGRSQLIIHSTKTMAIAWQMYLKLGFKRSEDLDFMQEKLPVFGFRMFL